MKGQAKVLICNLIIVLLAVASIVTLCVGTFWKIEVSAKIDKESMEKMAGEESSSNKEKSTEGEEASNAPEDEEESVSAEESQTTGKNSSDDGSFFNYLSDDFKLELGVSLDVKGGDLLKAVGGDKEAVSGIIDRSINKLFDDVQEQISTIFNEVIVAVMDQKFDEIVDDFTDELKEEMGKKDMTDEEVSAELEDRYGVSLDDIQDFKGEIKEGAKAFFNGDTAKLRETLDKSDALYALMKVSAKDDLKKEHQGEEDYEPTDAEIIERADKNKKEMLDGYDEEMETFKDEEGNVTKDSVMVGVFAMIDEQTGNSGENEENGESTNEIKTEEDVKIYLRSLIEEYVGDDVTDMITQVLGYIGYFLILVIATWAYVILKILIKLFMKNKTVSLFAPRFFGWMPHVFLVGIPKTLLLVIMKSSVIEQAAGEEAAETIAEAMKMIQINITSLTWVSAMATVVLLFIAIPYHKWRKELKRNGKLGKGSSRRRDDDDDD